MAFGAGQHVTNIGSQLFNQRVQHTVPTTTTTTPHAIGSDSPRFIAMGVGATTAARTAAVTDVSLSQEVETRTTGTESIITVTNTNDGYQVTGTITATNTRAVDEAGLWDDGTETTTTTAQANAGATSIAVTSGAVFAAGGGTLYAHNATNGTSQTIPYSSISTNTITCTALAGQINSGDRVVSGNFAASATFNVINLATNDSIAFTFKLQESAQ